MRGVHGFMVMVALPALLALAHDIFLFVTRGGTVDTLQETLGADAEPGVKSLFATLGWIWTHYSKESYKWVVENTSETVWAYINALLTQKAFFVGLGFAGFFYVILGIMKIFGAGPFSESGKSFGSGNKRIDAVLNKKQKPSKFKYKRK